MSSDYDFYVKRHLPKGSYKSMADIDKDELKERMKYLVIEKQNLDHKRSKHSND